MIKEKSRNYWVPTHKWQLVDWLNKNTVTSHKNFSRMNKDQLYAIYFSMRDRYERRFEDEVRNELEGQVDR